MCLAAYDDTLKRRPDEPCDGFTVSRRFRIIRGTHHTSEFQCAVVWSMYSALLGMIIRTGGKRAAILLGQRHARVKGMHG